MPSTASVADNAIQCEPLRMKVFIPLALLAVGAAPVEHPRTYLLSIIRIPLRYGEHQGLRYQDVGCAI